MNKRYTIREVADLIGISTDAIRLYEKEGLVTPHRDPQNAYRYYEAYDIQRILGIYLHRQLNVSIPEIRNIYEVETLPEISDSFSEFITQTENEIQNLQIKLKKLRFMKQHIDNLNEGLVTCSIKELPTLYMLYQQDFSKTLYENMKLALNSPVFSFGNFCYTLKTNAAGTYSPHALEFAIREPMMRVCPLSNQADTFKKINGCRCIYSVITAPDLNGTEWNLNRVYSYANEHGLTCGSEGYAFYIYSLYAQNNIIDFYEIYFPILE